jgi:4-phytase/acid phosphatase
MLAALAGPARVTALVGHDTNVASLGGLLDMHWRIPGYAPDDPPPGGAIQFELLRNRQGDGFVRASFRAQTLDALRRGTGTSVSQPLRIAGCAMLCPLDRFTAIVEKGLAAR